MLDILTLIQHTKDLMLNEKLGEAPDVSVLIQEYPLDPDAPEKGIFELRTALHISETEDASASPILDITHLIHCAQDLLVMAELGAPLPILKKVQSFLLPAFNNFKGRAYDLSITLSLPGIFTPYGLFHRRG
jgi:hypothetical protein